jgi:hypothetical protein
MTISIFIASVILIIAAVALGGALYSKYGLRVTKAVDTLRPYPDQLVVSAGGASTIAPRVGDVFSAVVVEQGTGNNFAATLMGGHATVTALDDGGEAVLKIEALRLGSPVTVTIKVVGHV